jgi:hypothetical protein
VRTTPPSAQQLSPRSKPAGGETVVISDWMICVSRQGLLLV